MLAEELAGKEAKERDVCFFVEMRRLSAIMGARCSSSPAYGLPIE
jgi:hypothetical protein